MKESDCADFMVYCQTGKHPSLLEVPSRRTCDGYTGLSSEERKKAMHAKKLQKAAKDNPKITFI